MTTPTTHLDEVVAALEDRADSARAALEELVEIPSISAPGHDPEQVRRSARTTRRLLTETGLAGVRLLEIDGAHPYVYGEWLEAGEHAPTVLLYAHHDVQPVATPERWTSTPFEPTERDGRLYGRGAADDKAGIMVHVAALGAWLAHGRLPVNVKVIIEGEEEIGSPHLGKFLDEHTDTVRADVIVLTDLPNWKVGVPGLTYTLRGLAELFVTVRALAQPIHSGMWGGPVPDALTGAVKLLSRLHDDQGRPAVAGLFDDVRSPTAAERERIDALDLDADELRAQARMVDGARLVGEPEVGLLERIWMRPAINVIGLDVPSVEQASNQLIAEVRAKISVRLAPGQDPARVQRVIADHLRTAVPWGLTLEVEEGVRVPAWVTEPSGPAFDAALAALKRAFGASPALLGCGGSIPFVQPFSQAFDGAPCLLTGIEDPATNAHGEDESLHLDDFHRACLAEAYLFAELGDRLSG